MKSKMVRGGHRFGLKKRIYAVAGLSIATLVFLTLLFIGVLNQQKSLLLELESNHLPRVAKLSSQFFDLSNSHVKLVDLLSSSKRVLSVRTVRSVGARFTKNLNQISGNLNKSRHRFTATKQAAESFDRLIANLRVYRVSVVSAVNVASLNLDSARRILRDANRNYRSINEDFEALIQHSRARADRSIKAALKSFDVHLFEFSAGVALVIVLLAAVVVTLLHAVSRDLEGITSAMSSLAAGRKDAHIPGLERRDEIGEMARATAIFKSHFQKLDALADLEESGKRLETEVDSLLESKKAYEEQVSELNTSTKSLAEERDAATAADKAKSELLSTISYDIRTPMNGLIGMAGLILDTQLSDQQRDYVLGVRESGEALLDVINNLLDYTKLEAGQLELEVSEFDLIALVESVQNMVKSDTGGGDLDVLIHVDSDVPQWVVGDDSRLIQALSNLLTTVAWSSASYNVSIQVSVEDRKSKAAVLRFDVVDHAETLMTHHGTSPQDQKWQKSDVNDHGSGSRGLSMAISERIAGLMGGQIGRDSADGGNSRVWLTVQLGIVETVAGDWRVQTPELKGRRVLIVDGTGATREVLGRQIQSWDMDADYAIDGRSALARLARADSQKMQFDATIVSHTLSDMKWMAFVRAMRSTDANKDVKVILTCRRDERPDPAVVEQLDICDCLHRPMTPSRLLDALVGAVQGRTMPFRTTMTGDEKAAVVSTEGGPKFRVLLADDNQINQKVVTAMLQPTGHRVDVVGNGIEAVKAVQTASYDVVLMDIQMPELDGIAATKEIRALKGDIAGIPIVAVTANAMDGDKEKYLSAGMDDYISKPIDQRQLLDAIARLGSGEGRQPSEPKSGTKTPPGNAHETVAESPPPEIKTGS